MKGFNGAVWQSTLVGAYLAAGDFEAARPLLERLAARPEARSPALREDIAGMRAALAERRPFVSED